MKRLLGLSWFVAGLVFGLDPARAQEQSERWNLETTSKEGRVTFGQGGLAQGSGGVHVRYWSKTGKETELTADKVQLNQATGDIKAEGAVFLRGEGHFWRGEQFDYNFKTKVMKAAEFRTGTGPFFVGGLSLDTDKISNCNVATNAIFTTDDLADPGYRIRCRKLTMIPGKSIEAEDATLLIGSVPVMYWPKYSRNLATHGDYWVVTPGYRSLYGPYVLGTYHHAFTTNFSTDLHLDYRQKRGIGIGPDFNYDAGRWGQGEFKFYYARDDAANTNSLGGALNNDRHRISFSHRVEIRTNLTVKAVVREQSDAFIIRDFIEREYQKNIQPSSFLEVNQLWSNWSLNILAQPRINDFFETVERLPDVRFTGFRQQIGVTPIYYESESSVGYFKHAFADNIKPDVAAWRADTYHQVLLPQQFFGWLNVTPRVGGRLTHYGETEGLGATAREANRGVFNTGVEVTLKYHTTLPNKEIPWLQAKGIRHIMEPGINYAYVPSPNRLPPTLPQFDGELGNLRLLPIEFPDYNAIDAVDSQNVFRFSLRNVVQTKRNDRIDTLLNWSLYTDWRVKPRLGQGTFADAFSELDFKPRDWLTLTSETRYDIDNGHFRIADHRATISPEDHWSLALGHRYVRNDPLFLGAPGNNLITSGIYYRINENYALRTRHFFEARDGRMEEQYYTLYRDFRSWVGALTFRVRDLRNGSQDYTIGVTFNLKAFPRYKLGQDSDNPSMLLGG
ncbi:MAG: LPS-assembly protein LptD [Limisphaerales bacterium]